MIKFWYLKSLLKVLEALIKELYINFSLPLYCYYLPPFDWLGRQSNRKSNEKPLISCHGGL